MSEPSSAVTAPSRAAHTSETTERTCADGAGAGEHPASSISLLFPPRDADAHTRRAWLAASPWPEVVFACAH